MYVRCCVRACAWETHCKCFKNEVVLKCECHCILWCHRSIDEWVSEDSFPSTVSPGSLLISLFLGTCAMLVKETGITVFGVCLLYDALVLCRKPLTQ